MFPYADVDGTHILSLPDCVYYHSTAISDVMLPRVLAGKRITRDTIAEMGTQGRCLKCKFCQYPICPFGK